MADDEGLPNTPFHDLNTQLTLISGYVQLAQRAASRTVPDDWQLAAYLSHARTEMSVLTALIAELQHAVGSD